MFGPCLGGQLVADKGISRQKPYQDEDDGYEGKKGDKRDAETVEDVFFQT